MFSFSEGYLSQEAVRFNANAGSDLDANQQLMVSVRPYDLLSIRVTVEFTES